ncbi:hypothetical protein HYX01_03975 [Candidatus Woesearchaeota archaeon]|nr:hypothetical protein [Candidatus Woesearchaeota archaeon]
MPQKKKVMLVAFSVMLVFLIVSCKGGQDAKTQTTPFLGGTQGLEIKFLESSPPNEVTAGTDFPFQAVVSLRNQGEFELPKENIKVNLIGFLPSNFGVADASVLSNKNPEDNPTPRKKDSEGNIVESTETFVTFPGATSTFNSNAAGTYIFRADVCYKYQTKAISEICVLENLISKASGSICEPRGAKTVFSSGSPVGVTSFRQTVAGKDKLQFTFDISHAGKGNVFEYDTAAAECPKDTLIRIRKENRVKVSVNTGLDGLKCVGLSSTNSKESTGIVTLFNGKRTITCTQDAPQNRKDFKKFIDITLDFNYLDHADKGLVVKRLS